MKKLTVDLQIVRIYDLVKQEILVTDEEYKAIQEGGYESLKNVLIDAAEGEDSDWQGILECGLDYNDYDWQDGGIEDIEITEVENMSAEKVLDTEGTTMCSRKADAELAAAYKDMEEDCEKVYEIK